MGKKLAQQFSNVYRGGHEVDKLCLHKSFYRGAHIEFVIGLAESNQNAQISTSSLCAARTLKSHYRDYNSKSSVDH